jgi:hypothetical protein
VELPIGLEVNSKPLLAIVFVGVEALPENPGGRGLSSVGDPQIQRRSVLRSPAPNAALQQWLVCSKLNSPCTLHGKTLIDGIADRPVLPVAGEALA